jgi:isoleucyl-tRNA synthetase
LRDEGLYRELLRRIQDLRKERDIEYTGRIRLSIEASQRIREILEKSRVHFMDETLCTDLDLSGSALDGAPPHEFTVDEEAVTVQLAAV